MAALAFILFFVWAAAMVLSIWALEAARMFARRTAKERLVRPDLPAHPPAIALILPIKGIEEDTPDNLRALVQLTYPRLRLLFAVESPNDPVIPLLRRLTAHLPAEKCEIVIAGPTTTRGQKIHNQLAAVARTSDADDILVFMDADARPHDRWLPALVEPLAGPHVGASTGYRLYVPALRNSRSSLASAQVSVLNAMIAALLGPAARNQAWGGSMAIRRKNFFDLGVHDAWQHALSDDYLLTHQVKRVHKKEIRFVHSCFVASTANFNWRSFFEFAPRQYKITRVCAPSFWLTGIAGTTLYVVAFSYPLLLWAAGLFIGRHDHLLLFMFAALYIANLIRGWLLLLAAKAALPEHAGRLQACAFWYTWGFPLAFFVNLMALVKSAFGRTIVWRGIRYTMITRTQTLVRHPPTATPAPTPPASPGPENPSPAPELVAK